MGAELKVTMDVDLSVLGKAAFEAYSDAKGGVTYDNKAIPPWTEVSEAVRAGWEAAAAAVLVNFVGNMAGKQ